MVKVTGFDDKMKEKKSNLWEAKYSNPIMVKLADVKLHVPWEISKEQVLKPSKIDKTRYEGLMEIGYENWPPVRLLKGNVLVDGYHRYALAKYVLGKDRIRATIQIN